MKFGHHGGLTIPVQAIEKVPVMISPAKNQWFCGGWRHITSFNLVMTQSLFDGFLCRVFPSDKSAFSFQGHPEQRAQGRTKLRLCSITSLKTSKLLKLNPKLNRKRNENNMQKRTDKKSVLILGAGPIVMVRLWIWLLWCPRCKALRERHSRI